eukprot:5760766-Alexandrium_andersonii.AAC.1
MPRHMPPFGECSLGMRALQMAPTVGSARNAGSRRGEILFGTVVRIDGQNSRYLPALTGLSRAPIGNGRE